MDLRYILEIVGDGLDLKMLDKKVFHFFFI